MQAYNQKYLNYIHSIVRTHRPYVTVGYDDLIQAGWYGVMQAIESFNPRKGKLDCYVYLLCRRRILDCLYRGVKKTKEEQHNDFVYHNPDLYYDSIMTPFDIVVEKESDLHKRQIISEKLELIKNELDNNTSSLFAKNNRLNPRLFYDHYFRSMTICDLEKKYHLSYRVIAHRIDDIRVYFRRRLWRRKKKLFD